MSDRPGPKSDNKSQGVRPPGQSRWTLFLLALMVALLVLLFDFSALRGCTAQ